MWSLQFAVSVNGVFTHSWEPLFNNSYEVSIFLSDDFIHSSFHLFDIRGEKNFVALRLLVAFSVLFFCFHTKCYRSRIFIRFIKCGIFFSCSEARCESLNDVFNCSICPNFTLKENLII